MIKKLFFVLVIGSLSTLAFADNPRFSNSSGHQNSSKDEIFGFFSGLTAGGLIAGPPGAVIGGALGALLGDKIDRSEQQIAGLESSLESSRKSLVALQAEADGLRKKVQLAMEENDRTKATLVNVARVGVASQPCCNNTVLSMNFRSGSSNIETHYREQLASFARLSKQFPETIIEISGFADRNGKSNANQILSQKRTETIKNYLTGMGVQSKSITTISYGESKPLHQNQTFENDFFDRRVQVKLTTNGGQIVSRSQQHQ